MLKGATSYARYFYLLFLPEWVSGELRRPAIFLLKSPCASPSPALVPPALTAPPISLQDCNL